jgi:hypothetical protein
MNALLSIDTHSVAEQLHCAFERNVLERVPKKQQ